MDRVIVHPDAALTARSAGMRLLLALIERQSLHSPLHVALTGGALGIQMLTSVIDEPLAGAVDWTGVHLWWGDERFAEDAERNASQARPWIDSLPIPAENVHEVARPGEVADVAAAADAYAAAVADVHFDVVILGVGPDGHVASLFPGRAEIEQVGVAALAVTESPKPPAERVSLSREKLEEADEIWFVAAGEGKREAVAASLAGGADSPALLPVARVRAAANLWLLDVEAVSAPE